MVRRRRPVGNHSSRLAPAGDTRGARPSCRESVRYPDGRSGAGVGPHARPHRIPGAVAHRVRSRGRRHSRRQRFWRADARWFRESNAAHRNGPVPQDRRPLDQRRRKAGAGDKRRLFGSRRSRAGHLGGAGRRGRGSLGWERKLVRMGRSRGFAGFSGLGDRARSPAASVGGHQQRPGHVGFGGTTLARLAAEGRNRGHHREEPRRCG